MSQIPQARLRYKPITVSRVRLACACGGEMVCTGEGFTQIDTTWTHRCSKCGVTEAIVNDAYPKLIYSDEKPR